MMYNKKRIMEKYLQKMVLQYNRIDERSFLYGVKCMGGMNILFDKKSPQQANENIEIAVEFEEEIDFKVIIGNDGVWNTIKEFNNKSSCVWTPKEDGNYMVMVQGKRKGSDKPFEYLAREEYIIGKYAGEDKVIKERDHAMDDIRYFASTVLAREYRWADWKGV